MPGEELQYGYIGIEQVVWLQLSLYVLRMNLHIIIFNMYAGRSKYRVIVRAESIEVLRIYFGGTVAACQVILKEDTYFRHDRPAVGMPGSGNFDTCQQIFFTVGTEHADRKLRTREDDGLVEALEHKTESGCGVGHGIRAVKDDKARILIVVVADNAYEFAPGIRIHIRRIHRRIELIGRDVIVEALQFGNMLEQVGEIEIFQCTCFRIFYHSDSSARVNQENGRIICFL